VSKQGGISIVNEAEFRRALEKAAAKVTEGAEKAVREEVDAIRDDALKFAPRDKGVLEAGIDATAAGSKGTVRSKARHAGFVEHGTFKDKAQPYMTPAAARSRRRLPARAAAIIKNALEGLR
jgi:HK97 gp10 family phage protein